MNDTFPKTMTFKAVVKSYGRHLGDREPMVDMPNPTRDGTYRGNGIFAWIQSNARSYGLAMSMNNCTYR
jgi:hypothetical protein